MLDRVRPSPGWLRRPGAWLGLVLVLSGALGVWHADWRLNSGRRWDERFSLRNADSMLSGVGKPQNAYYPSLSFLPATAAFWVVNGISRAAGAEPPIRIHGDHATPTTYLVARLLSVCFILAALALAFRIGVLCCDGWIGLMAAALLAFSPQVIDKSAILKPDALLLASTLAAVWLALRVLAKPSTARFLLAGAAIGIAMSAKYNGGPVAFSLVVVAALIWKRERRAGRWLLLAAAGAVVAFVVLNPWLISDPSLYRHALDFQVTHYERMGEVRSGGSHLAQLAFFPAWVASPMALGLLPALLGFAGLVAWTVSGWRERLRGASRRTAVLGGFLLGYTVLYVASSTNLVGRNWLPLLPYIAIASAWTALRLWKLGVGHWPVLGRAWLWLPLVTAAGLLWFLHGAGYVYRLQVPTTAEVATSWILSQSAPTGGRMLLTEVSPWWGAIADQGKGLGVIEHDPLLGLPAPMFASSDAILVRASELEGPAASRYRAALARLPGADENRVAPALFERRGPALVVVVARWQRVSAASVAMVAGSTPREWSGSLPHELAGTKVSFTLDVRSTERIADLDRIRVRLGTIALPRAIGRRGDQRITVVTARATAQARARLELRLPPGEPGASRIAVEAYGWREKSRGVEAERGSSRECAGRSSRLGWQDHCRRSRHQN